ncbi:uncharacterized protein BKCO1_1000556 [Diplodia corticola]|uniref:Tachykinin family protein n=1 Tax=Diplodia corticola TaxID=236234 RepID=A0A1J9RJU6_9PEZI|nr:uncharacterized protein BKCO1_1000556 [Diplodia corticola]OJD40274.1 hypothetical protein BKCO1_1000556 [Diplodia corticola]
MALSRPDSLAFSRSARPAFAASPVSPAGVSQTPSTFLFVDAGTTQSREQRRQIRAQVMFATHEARRRRGMKGSEDPEKAQKDRHVRRTESPLQDASVMHEDPFDSLPVKAFPGMHNLIFYHFDVYPESLPFVDDPFVTRKQNTKARRSNTVWDVMSSGETSFLVLLAEMARLFNSTKPSAKWRVCQLKLRGKALQSVREGLSSSNHSDSYIAAVAGMQGGASIVGDGKTARAHLDGLRELVRLRGGIHTFSHVARRIIVWVDLYVCATHQLLPAIPPTPLAPSTIGLDDDDDDDDDDNTNNPTPSPPPSPFPPAFLALVATARARTLARLPPPPTYTSTNQPGCCVGVNGADAVPVVVDGPLTRIFHALHLVGAANSPAWVDALMAPGPTRDAVASVLDGAAHAVLVELAKGRRADNGGEDGGEDGGNWVGGDWEGDNGCGWGGGCGGIAGEEDAGGVDAAGHRWLRGVLLHAAHVYLRASLCQLPPAAPINVLFLERLWRALDARAGEGVADRREEEEEDGGCDGGGVCSDGEGLRGNLARCEGVEDGAVWALAVGWYLADRVTTAARTGSDGFRMAARAGVLLAWFEDRIADCLLVFDARGEEGTERAARAVADFPGTDEFRREWHRLLLQERFRERSESLGSE